MIKIVCLYYVTLPQQKYLYMCMCTYKYICMYIYIHTHIYGYMGWEDPLEEGIETYSSICARRIPTDREAWQAIGHGVTKS